MHRQALHISITSSIECTLFKIKRSSLELRKATQDWHTPPRADFTRLATFEVPFCATRNKVQQRNFPVPFPVLVSVVQFELFLLCFSIASFRSACDADAPEN